MGGGPAATLPGQAPPLIGVGCWKMDTITFCGHPGLDPGSRAAVRIYAGCPGFPPSREWRWFFTIRTSLILRSGTAASRRMGC